MHLFHTRLAIIFATLFFISFDVQARNSLNSMCYVQSKPGAKIQGDRAQSLFEIASVSKVVTGYWALHKLGPYYRFQTQVYVTPVSGGKGGFDVHIQGARDPFWGRHLTHYLFAELHRIGVHNIRHLSFDENFTMRWRVMSDFIETLTPTKEDIKAALRNHLRDLSSEYPSTWKEARRAQIDLAPRIVLKAADVSYVPAKDFNLSEETRSFILKSAPLYRYIKQMNVVSNNHVADKFYDLLGGGGAFKNFVQETMDLDSSDIRFINGSGNSVVVGTDSKGRTIKEYNKASCETLVRILMQLQKELLATKSLDLKDVMAVSRSDGGSTLMPRYATIPNSLVAKTGTVDPAVTLAGMISTAHGDVYFGIFYGSDGPADWNGARNNIRSRVFDLISKFGGRKSFSYSSSLFLPFDKKSELQPVVPLSLAQH